MKTVLHTPLDSTNGVTTEDAGCLQKTQTIFIVNCNIVNVFTFFCVGSVCRVKHKNQNQHLQETTTSGNFLRQLTDFPKTMFWKKSNSFITVILFTFIFISPFCVNTRFTFLYTVMHSVVQQQKKSYIQPNCNFCDSTKIQQVKASLQTSRLMFLWFRWGNLEKKGMRDLTQEFKCPKNSSLHGVVEVTRWMTQNKS